MHARASMLPSLAEPMNLVVGATIGLACSKGAVTTEVRRAIELANCKLTSIGLSGGYGN
jgi:hypothetical protein